MVFVAPLYFLNFFVLMVSLKRCLCRTRKFSGDLCIQRSFARAVKGLTRLQKLPHSIQTMCHCNFFVAQRNTEKRVLIQYFPTTGDRIQRRRIQIAASPKIACGK